MSRARRGERGQTTVELALALPLVAFIVAAMIEIAMVGFDQLRLWHAAREAVRAAAVEGDERAISTAAERAGLHDIEVSVEPDIHARTFGRPVTVRLAYSPPGHVPLVGSMIAGVRLEASATMRIERP